MKVGVLALQGCVEPHLRMLSKIGVENLSVRSAQELATLDRLILPGGESTTMLKLLNLHGLIEPIINFAKAKPVWAICAGAILAAKIVKNPEQTSLGLINITAHRNFYGSQRESFSTKLKTPCGEMSVDFIRAPLLTPNTKSVEVLAKHEEETVLLRENNILVSSFHSELGSDTRLHEFFMAI